MNVELTIERVERLRLIKNSKSIWELAQFWILDEQSRQRYERDSWYYLFLAVAYKDLR